MQETIPCAICGKHFGQLTHAHLKKHDISIAEYRERHGEIQSEAVLYKTRTAGHKGGGNAGATAAHNAAKAARKAIYDLNPRRCQKCDDPFDYETDSRQKFCSHSCAASNNNPCRNRHQKSSKRRLVNCHNCLMEMFIQEGKSQNFCSLACRASDTEKRFLIRGENGQLRNYHLRAYILKTREYKCESCGITEWKGQPAPLQCDHRDGNSDNNMPDNIDLICANCHMLTPTWGTKNRGKGRNTKRMLKRKKAALIMKHEEEMALRVGLEPTV